VKYLAAAFAVGLLAGHGNGCEERTAAAAGHVNAGRRPGGNGQNLATRRAGNLFADEVVFGGETLAATAGYNYRHARGGMKGGPNNKQ